MTYELILTPEETNSDLAVTSLKVNFQSKGQKPPKRKNGVFLKNLNH
jgi:hypothetical protein